MRPDLLGGSFGVPVCSVDRFPLWALFLLLAITVFAPMLHPAQLSEEQLLASCTLRNDRRSGPGGQHRNKVETAVIALHQPTGVRAEASERRSQKENRRVAIARLRLALALEYRSPAAKDAMRPTELWLARGKSGRIQVSTEHEDFPAILAELLDFLDARAYDLPQAAEYFAVSASQLVKLLRSYPPAMTQVNRKRLDIGLHKLT